MKRKKDWHELAYDERRKREKRIHREAGYPRHWRVVSDGKVISHSDPRLGAGWAERMERAFFDNITKAKNDPNWVFIGYRGLMSASEYLDFHRQRTGTPLNNVSILPPQNEAN